jgi:hypothetical protein
MSLTWGRGMGIPRVCVSSVNMDYLAFEDSILRTNSVAGLRTGDKTRHDSNVLTMYSN